jgi:hypothetical protein
VARDQGNCGEARALLEESLATERDLEDKHGIHLSLAWLGWVTHDQGNYEGARVLLEEGLAIGREVGNRHTISGLGAILGKAAAQSGDDETARERLKESMAVSQELGHGWGIAMALEGWGAMAVAQGASERAARLLGAAERLRGAIGRPLPLADRPQRDRSVAAVRDALGEQAFAAAWAAGRAMSIDAAVAFALEAEG